MDKTEDRENDDWGSAISLDGRINIYPNKPVPELNTPGGVAFAARYKNDASQDLAAIICNRGLLPRVDSVNPYRMIDSAGIVRLRDSGVINWPEQGGRFFALVYERPLSERYWRTLDEVHPTMSEDGINHHFVMPLIKAMLELQRMGIGHGGIRPTNIFWRDGSTTAPQIGEALSAPCGVGQPALFETIERAQCPPLARGPALHVDDCYAFGVTLAMVVLGSNPFQGMDERSVLRSKMEKGSFNTLVGARRLSGSHIELLRGLLADDARQRWTASDLEQWMNGRRLTPKSSDVGRRASRHFDIGGKEFWQVRPLAAALAENVSEAVKVIESGSLLKWVTRSLGDEERAKSLSEAIDQLKDRGNAAHYQDQLVTRASIALDPSAPIRYRGLSVMPAGVATMLADAIANGKDVQILSEIISAQFVTLWVNMQKDTKIDLVPLAQLMERVKGFAERTAFGSGIERAVYELNPDLPCLSHMFRGDCVLSTKALLPALERVASSGSRPSEPMDRHLAAFLIVRDKRSESLFNAMSPTETPLHRGLALLALFGEMQYRYGPDRLPGLTGWLLPLVDPCIKRFLSKPFQDKVREQAQEAVQKGDLSLLLRRVDDPKRVTSDEQNFLHARLMYQDVQREIASIESDLANRGNVATNVGRPVAASLASILALVMISVTLGRALLRALLG